LIANLIFRGHLAVTAILSLGAARAEWTTGRKIGEIGRLSFDTPQPLRLVGQFRHSV
jgi:hypothetical protein